MDEIQKTKILIIDDHPLFRAGLRMSLKQKSNIEIVGEAENGFKAVERVLSDKPDLVLLDMEMPGISGIGVIRLLRKSVPDLKIVVLSAHDEEKYVRDSMKSGACGYVLKNIDLEALVKIIDNLCRGKQVISPYLLNLAVDECPEPTEIGGNENNQLTVRERDVLRHVVEGKENKEIADILFISTETVKSHLKHIFEKLNVTNRVEAVKTAIEQHILDF